MQATCLSACAILPFRCHFWLRVCSVLRSVPSSFDAHGCFLACVGRWPFCLLFVTFPLRRFSGLSILPLASVPALLCEAFSVLLLRLCCLCCLWHCRLAGEIPVSVFGQLLASGALLVLPALPRICEDAQEGFCVLLAYRCGGGNFRFLCDLAIIGVICKQLREGSFVSCWI